MSKFSKLVAALAVVPMLAFSAPVFADSPGQLSNGASNYKVRNVTQNGNYGQSTTAACGDTVKYSVTLANSDFGMLSNVIVNANLATGAISASATNSAGANTSVSGSVNVATSGTLQYVAGSTVRINSDNTVTTPEADGVATTNGVNVGSLNGSTYIFVQFQAKVNCPTPPAQLQVCRLSDKKVVTINASDFDSTKYTKDLTQCNATVTPPTTLVNTGAGDVAALFAGVAAIAAVGYNLVVRRQARR